MLEGENQKSQSIISKGQVYWVPYGYFGENIESHIEKDDYLHKFFDGCTTQQILKLNVSSYISWFKQTKRMGMWMHISWFMDDIYEP
jgi:hypothetical protein